MPRDAADGKDAILEIKSGEGGEESALFAADLLRMYTRYAEQRGWRTEVLDDTPSDLGGYKPVTVGSVGIAVRKGDTELLAKINASLAKLKSNGTTTRILEKWGQKAQGS